MPKTPKTPKTPKPPKPPKQPKKTQEPSKPPVAFMLFLVFATPRAHYAALLSTDRSLYLPLTVMPFQAEALSCLVKKIPSPYCDPYLLVTDHWRAFGCEIQALYIEFDDEARLLGHMHLREKNELGMNMVDLACSPVDVVALSMLADAPVMVREEQIPYLCAQVAQPTAADDVIVEQIRRGQSILDVGGVLDQLLKLPPPPPAP